MTTVPVPNRLAVPVTLAGQQASTRTATLEQLRERLESGEPPEKKVSRLSEEEQRLVQQAFQRNLFNMARQLPMKIRINGRGEQQPVCQAPAPFRAGSRPGTRVGALQVLPPALSPNPQKDLETRESLGGSVATETSVHQAEVIFQGACSSSGVPCFVAKRKSSCSKRRSRRPSGPIARSSLSTPAF